MADVITRFKLETTQYDSKLRDAAKSLSALSKQAEMAGNDFDKFTKESIAAARALGQVESGANNTKDKVRDLVGAYNEVSRAYNALTDDQKRSDFAKAMSESLEQLQTRITETKQELYGLGEVADKVSGGGFLSGEKMSGMLQVFGGNLMTKAAGWVAGFASEMGDAIKQGVELAKQGEGIRIAFERLGRGDILDGLRQATHGTVTDLELMKAAVKFNDFKLPLDELGTMLAFAQQKAKDTGQSVDYMVDSIVTGLGRKSLMILDNLGLSAAQVKEKMAETGDMTKAVGEIIREEMSKAGDYVETAADRATQANVNLQNKIEELGRKFAPLQEASDNFWTSMKISILDVVGGPLATLLNGLTEAGRLMNAYNKNNKYPGGDGQQTRTQKYIQNLQNSSNRESLYNRQLESINRVINSLDKQSKDKQKLIDKSSNADYIAAQTELKKRIDIQMQSWMQIREEYKAGAKTLLTPVKPVIDTSETEQSVASLTKKLKDLQAERQKAIKAGDTQKSKDLLKQINQTKADIKGLDHTALKTTGSETHKQTDAEKAQQVVDNALQSYAQTIKEADLRMEAGLDTSLDHKKKELQAQEQLFTAYGKAIAIHKDPKFKEAYDKAAKEYQHLAEEVKQQSDQQAKAKETARQQAATQKKLTEAMDAAAKAVKENDLKSLYAANKKVEAAGGKPVDIPVTYTVTVNDADALSKLKGIEGIAIDDKTLSVTVNDKNALEKLKDIEGVTIEPKAIPITYTNDNLQAFISNLKEHINGSDIGTDLYNKLTAQIADATMLGNIISIAMKEGIDVAEFDPQTLWKKLFSENPADYIDDDLWKQIAEKISKQSGKKVKIDTKTGEAKESGGKDKSFVQVADQIMGGVNQMVGGLEKIGIEIPEGFRSVLNGISGVLDVLQTINILVEGIKAMETVGTFLGLFAHGGIVPHAQNGVNVVPGNHYSGDVTPILANAGEVVLNRSQVGNIASQLSGIERGSAEAQPYINGEMIFLGLQAYMRRSGLGEIVTAER